MMQRVINQQHLDTNRLIDFPERGHQSVDFLICSKSKTEVDLPHSKPM